jgi:hypothetical protein
MARWRITVFSRLHNGRPYFRTLVGSCFPSSLPTTIASASAETKPKVLPSQTPRKVSFTAGNQYRRRIVRSPSSAAKKVAATVSNGPHWPPLRISSVGPSPRSDHRPKPMKMIPATRLIQKNGKALPTNTHMKAEMKLMTMVPTHTPSKTIKVPH